MSRLLAVSSLAAVRSGIASSVEASQKHALQKPACDPPWDANGERKKTCAAK